MIHDDNTLQGRYIHKNAFILYFVDVQQFHLEFLPKCLEQTWQNCEHQFIQNLVSLSLLYVHISILYIFTLLGAGTVLFMGVAIGQVNPPPLPPPPHPQVLAYASAYLACKTKTYLLPGPGKISASVTYLSCSLKNK
jgi:hypothetical protein